MDHVIPNKLLHYQSFTSSGTGYYLWALGSGFKTYDTARIVSPRIETQGDGQRCLEFHYSLHGTNIENFYVWFVQGSYRYAVWTRYGDQGIDWHKVKFNSSCLFLNSFY